MVSIKTSRPIELVCMDFLSLEPDSHNTKDVLVVTDHFTKYAIAIPTKDQKATTVARCLWEQFLVHYGFPERLHSDQDRDFESLIIKELCTLVGIKKTRTSPYHPRRNPVERFTRTLLSMLDTQMEKEKKKWREYVKPLAHAYDCTRNDVTGFSPYELMFGRQPRLPIDIASGLPVRDSSVTSHSQYVKNLMSYLTASYQQAMSNAKKVADKNKQRFDMRVRESSLETGDRVLVHNLHLRSKHKLADRWESTVYVVQQRAGDLPLYIVCPEAQDGPTRTLHRDLLLPCGFLSEVEEEPEETRPIIKPRTRRTPIQPDERLLDSEEEDDSPLFYPVEMVETEARVLEPVSMALPEREMAIENKTSPQTKSSPDLESVPEKDTGNLPVNLPEPSSADVSNSPAEKGSTNLTGNLPDLTLNNPEPVENDPMEQEPENNPC